MIKADEEMTCMMATQPDKNLSVQENEKGFQPQLFGNVVSCNTGKNCRDVVSEHEVKKQKWWVYSPIKRIK